MKSEAVFFAVYRWIIWPLLRTAFGILARFNSKIAKGLELRERVDGRAPWIKLLPPTPPTIWIHASSGEFEYAKPVITKLKAADSNVKVVVTFFSPTYADNVRKFAGVDWAVPLPWDTPSALSAFLDSYRPAALLIARTDAWPEMARQVSLRKIASCLFSATLTKNSSRTRGIGRVATRVTLDQLDEIFCVSDEDAETFRSLGLQHAQVSVTGDTRYDQVKARLENAKLVKSEIFQAARKSGRSLFVSGSTWTEDEAVLVPALAHLQTEVGGILVPHEPTETHLLELETLIANQGLRSVRYTDESAARLFAEPGVCLIVDRVGFLAELYLEADIAFVGGSFRKTVHSVMEPLAAGAVTLVGPKHTNNREAVLFQSVSTHPVSPTSAGAVRVVDSIDSIVKTLNEFHNATNREGAKREIRAAVGARTGASDRLVKWLLAKLSN